jgi:putative endonuclease
VCCTAASRPICPNASPSIAAAQHRSGTGSKFARRHNCTWLVYAEPHETIHEAIAREKAIKAWPRLGKLRLIQEMNPTWRDLFDDLNA